MKSQIIGSTLLLIGTAIGAGMLALPLVGAQAGFLFSSLLLIGLWALMMFTGLLVLEVNLAFKPYRNGFSTMAEATLGFPGKVTAWLSCLFLLYALTAAYIAGDSSLLSVGIKSLFGKSIPQWIDSVLFTLILGGAVFWHTKVVDYLNRTLMSFKGLFLIFTLMLLLPRINFVELATSGDHLKYIWACAPIFLGAFGFHTVLPSLTTYIGKKPRVLRKIILAGTIIPLCIYILWLLGIFSVVPVNGPLGFIHIEHTHQSVGGMIHSMDVILKNKWLTAAINGFSNIAMTTSFLGVSLGLFDFLADACKRPNTRWGRMQTASLTFIPPLAFAIFYPEGFILALGYAAIAVAVLEILLPVLMVMKLRKSHTLKSPYRVKAHPVIFVIVFLAGCVLIGLQLF